MPTTTVMGLPYPQGSDDADVPADMGALAARLDATPGVESLTSAQIAAIAAPQRPAGRVVHNSTTGLLMVSTGASFVDVADPSKLPLAGGTMTGKITLDGNPSAALHAVPRQWVDPVYGIGTVGAGQSLTAGEWNTIGGWTVSESQSMVFTSITFPVTGVWVVTAHASVQFSSNPNEKYIARLMLNGSTVVAQAADFPVASTFDAVMALSAVVNVSASNTIGLSVYNGAGATRTLRDARLAATLIAR